MPGLAAAQGRWSAKAALLALLALLGAASVFTGYAPLGFGAVWQGITGADDLARIIVWDIRAPRLVLGLLVGASLGMGGAVLQGLFRNPLAEPGVVGVAPAAGLGAVIAIYFGWSAGGEWIVPLAAMAGAALAMGLLLLIALGEASILTLVLAGAGLSSLCVALISLALNFAPNPFALSEIVYWLMGSLKDRSWDDVITAAPFIAAGLALMPMAARGLDALALGEDVAASLGVPLMRLSAIAIAGVTLSAGAATAATGAIGFVGLIAPHAMRPFAGHEPGRLLWPSAFAGAALVTAADVAVRLIGGTPELMLGVVVALVGAPLFVHILFSTRRAMR